jgi:hypothetical protein
VRRALLVLALVACTQYSDVLIGTLTECPTDLVAAAGQPCDFQNACVAPGTDPCSSITATCTRGKLHVDVPTGSGSGCTTCTDDSGCATGAAICGSNATCEACPPLDICPILDCPAGTAHLMRNGCPVCACAPAPTCSIGSGGSVGSDPTNSPGACSGSSATCYRGSDCAAGCTPDDPGCCTAECGEPGCTGPIPTGCAMPCGLTTSASCASNTCIASHCTCANGAFECTPMCANTSPSCSVPATGSGAG